MVSYKNILFATLVVANGIIAQAQKSTHILLINPTSFQRDDELVVIPRKQLEKRTGIIPTSKYIVVKDEDNEPVVVQLDDKNGDTTSVEAIFLQSFKPWEKITLHVSFSSL